MVFGRKIKMEFERVKVSPEMVGISGGWLAMLAFFWNVSLNVSDLHMDMSDLHTDMSNLRVDMSDLRVDMGDLRTELKGDIAHLNERMARVEGLLEGYIKQSRAEEGLATAE